jgi:hypothetical protein
MSKDEFLGRWLHRVDSRIAPLATKVLHNDVASRVQRREERFGELGRAPPDRPAARVAWEESAASANGGSSRPLPRELQHEPLTAAPAVGASAGALPAAVDPASTFEQWARARLDENERAYLARQRNGVEEALGDLLRSLCAENVADPVAWTEAKLRPAPPSPIRHGSSAATVADSEVCATLNGAEESAKGRTGPSRTSVNRDLKSVLVSIFERAKQRQRDVGLHEMGGPSEVTTPHAHPRTSTGHAPGPTHGPLGPTAGDDAALVGRRDAAPASGPRGDVGARHAQHPRRPLAHFGRLGLRFDQLAGKTPRPPPPRARSAWFAY